jgi:hypothetical protein
MILFNRVQNVFPNFQLGLIIFVAFCRILHFATIQAKWVKMVSSMILVLSSGSIRIKDFSTVHAKGKHTVVTAKVLALTRVILS